MKLRAPDSSFKRMAMAIGAGIAIIAFVGWAFFLASSSAPAEKVNGLRIVAAAQAFTRSLRAAGKPIPPSVKLDELVAHGLLRPADAAAFHGLDATVLLTSTQAGPQTVLMRVHFQDGTDLLLLADGSVQSVAQGHWKY
jgi:hypothetical protein